VQQLANNPQAAQQHYLLPMPKWEERESTLLRRLQAQEGVDADAAGKCACCAALERVGGSDCCRQVRSCYAALERVGSSNCCRQVRSCCAALEQDGCRDRCLFAGVLQGQLQACAQASLRSCACVRMRLLTRLQSPLQLPSSPTHTVSATVPHCEHPTQ